VNKKPANVFGKRNAQRGSFGMGPLLRLGVKIYLCSGIHDVTIKPPWKLYIPP